MTILELILVVSVATFIVAWIYPQVTAFRRKNDAVAEGIREVRRGAIQVWWKEAEARCALHREFIRGMQSEDQPAVGLALRELGRGVNALQLHPILRQVASASLDAKNCADSIADDEEAFLSAAEACGARVGKPGVLESPAFDDVRRHQVTLSSSYLRLREEAEKWLIQ